jgi:voltage-gated potassium channel
MPRDLDKAALHATFDVLLQALARPKAGDAPGAAGEPAPPDALVTAYQGAKRSIREMATRDPIDALASVVGVGTLLFYLAEKGKNDKCVNLWDALNFITTSLSVGYDDVYAKTSAGKAIAALVMTVGPSLSARMMDPPKIEAEREAAESAAMQRAVVERLDSILETLRAGAGTAPRP